MEKKRIIGGLLAATALTLGSLVAATPASAANQCGPMGLTKDGPLASSGYVTQSCDAGTQVTYEVDCLTGDVQQSRYFPQGLSALTRISCPGGSGDLLLGVTPVFS